MAQEPEPRPHPVAPAVPRWVLGGVLSLYLVGAVAFFVLPSAAARSVVLCLLALLKLGVVTVSGGLAQCVDGAAGSGKRLLDSADRALFLAKARGRDCVVASAGIPRQGQQPALPA